MDSSVERPLLAGIETDSWEPNTTSPPLWSADEGAGRPLMKGVWALE